MKKTDFLGIDISKDFIDCALLNAEHPGSFRNKQFNNDLDGFDAMMEWLIKNKTDLDRCMFCMEHTGTYGLLLFAWLSQKGADFCVEPGLKIKRSLGMTRGKDDQIDARRIADYACTHVHKLKPFSLPSNQIISIKQLLTYREQLVRIRTSLKNSIKSHEQYEQITKSKTVTDDISALIQDHNSRIMIVEQKIIEAINSDRTSYCCFHACDNKQLCCF